MAGLNKMQMQVFGRRANEALFDFDDPEVCVILINTTSTFTVPTNATYTYNYSIRTEDGQSFDGVTGNQTITFPASGTYKIAIFGTFPQFYFNNTGDKLKILKVLSWGTSAKIGWNTSQSNSFYGCSNLNNIANGDILNNMTFAIRMFVNCDSLVIAEGVTFANVSNGSYMFNLSSMSSFPSTVNFANLDRAFAMFQQSGVVSIPDSVTFDNVTDARNMFYLAGGFTTLGNATTFSKVTNATNMFRSTSITDLPSTVKFNKLNLGPNMFLDETINTSRYSQFLIDLDNLNINTGVTLHGGNSTYNSSASAARASLVSKGWLITDGGLV